MITEANIDQLVSWLESTYNIETKYYRGKKYYKISRMFGVTESAYAFIDFEGNIYQAATWNRPAKHIRGHIDRPWECCDRYSVKYLRGH